MTHLVEPLWLSLAMVLAMHDEVLAEHGGAGGIRDRAWLESALARPRNSFICGAPSIFTLAAEYAFGIVNPHPFIDGNKRTALVSCDVFLQLNGHQLDASEPAAVATFQNLAAGSFTLSSLEDWILCGSTQLQT